MLEYGAGKAFLSFWPRFMVQDHIIVGSERHP